MKPTQPRGRERRRNSPARRALGAALLIAASAHAHGASATGSFRVTVDLFTQDKQAVECGRSAQPGPSGDKVFIACVPQTRSPVHATAPFLLHIFREGLQIGTVDGFMASGTITSWRVVHLANRDYLEIVVGW
jgi:hypothetical protein